MKGSMIVALGATALVAFAATPASAQRWGFESGTLDGWSAAGDAFASQPTFGNNIAPRRPGESPGNDGNYWLGTFENHRFAGSPPGTTQGDAPQGTLTSPPFVIDGQSVAFLIGGGRDIDHEYVALLVKWEPGMPPPARPDVVTHLPDGDYLTFQKATGRDDEHMIRTIWPVDRWRGRTARFQLVDHASGPWGHINADSFQLSWEAPLGRAVLVPASPLGTAVPVAPGSPPIAYPVGGGTVTVAGPANAPVTASPVGGPVTAYPVGGGPVIVAPAAPSGVVYREPPLPQVQRDPGMPPGPDESGHFQLIALEFIAAHQTRDDLLESDGPGDEIMVRSDNLSFTPDGRFVDVSKAQSGIFGGQVLGGFLAGSAVPGFSAHADAGGIKTGDHYPYRPRAVMTNGDLPMVLWDGVLTRGGNGVVIIPSLWEMDSRDFSASQQGWDAGMIRARQGGLGIARAFSVPVEDWDSPIWPRLFGPVAAFDNGNRPIGAAVHPFHPMLPGSALPHDRGMDVQSIPLTYDKAMLFAARHPTSFDSGSDPGVSVGDAQTVPRGGIVMRMTDPAGNDGDYYLIMQLVRVD